MDGGSSVSKVVGEGWLNFSDGESRGKSLLDDGVLEHAHAEIAVCDLDDDIQSVGVDCSREVQKVDWVQEEGEISELVALGGLREHGDVKFVPSAQGPGVNLHGAVGSRGGSKVDLDDIHGLDLEGVRDVAEEGLNLGRSEDGVVDEEGARLEQEDRIGVQVHVAY